MRWMISLLALAAVAATPATAGTADCARVSLSGQTTLNVATGNIEGTLGGTIGGQPAAVSSSTTILGQEQRGAVAFLATSHAFTFGSVQLRTADNARLVPPDHRRVPRGQQARDRLGAEAASSSASARSTSAAVSRRTGTRFTVTQACRSGDDGGADAWRPRIHRRTIGLDERMTLQALQGCCSRSGGSSPGSSSRLGQAAPGRPRSTA